MNCHFPSPIFRKGNEIKTKMSPSLLLEIFLKSKVLLDTIITHVRKNSWVDFIAYRLYLSN